MTNIKTSKKSLVDEYLDISKAMTEKYGSHTIVFIQAGSFYEVYGYDRNNVNFDICEKLLNIRITRKHSADGRKDSAYMAGIPDHAFKKYERILVSHNYTVVYVDQVSVNPITRKITKVVSPGCSMDDDDTRESILASCMIEKIGDDYYLSVSTFDSNRGEIKILETNQNFDGKLNDIYQYLDEMITNNGINECIMNSDSDITMPQFSSKILMHKNVLNGNEKKIYMDIHSYIPEKLETYFKHYKNLYIDIIDSLELQTCSASDLGNLVFMLEFLEHHEPVLVENLTEPKIVKDTQIHDGKMVFFNNVLSKLQVHSSKDDNSLFKILNSTLTCSGKKKFLQTLSNPISDISELNQRYEAIEFLMKEANFRKFIKTNLKLLDLERIYRKFAVGKIDAYNEVHKISKMNNNIFNIILKFNENDKSKDLFWFPENEVISNFEKYSNELDNFFNMENCASGEGNVFKEGNVIEVDNLWIKYIEKRDIFTKMHTFLTHVMKESITLKNTDRDGYYFETTKKRGQKLEKLIEEKNKKNDFDGSEFIEKFSKNLKFNFLSSQCKITSDMIKKTSEEITILKMKIESTTKMETQKIVKHFYEKYYKTCLEPIIQFLSWMDVSYACAENTIANNYIRPQIRDTDSSFIEAKSLRHPIIEKLMINEKKRYVTNDVYLSAESSYLIFGVNSVGKSSLLKSIGLNLIMAQSGMFVSAREFIFNPYEKLCVRIGNNDDLFNAHSSFVCEMREANTIVKNADEKTLVLADEMCCSTEISSATAIVTSTLQWLDMNKSTYVFASHFFELLDTCKDISSLKVKHLKVQNKNNELIFDRILSDGPPNVRNYGTIVASKIFQNDVFVKMIKRNDVEKKSKSIIRKSKYNLRELRMSCEICGYKPRSMNDLPIDTHHINFQCNANSTGFIDDFHKDVRSNLVSLCKNCHIEVHQGKTNVNGWVSKDNGVSLDFTKSNISNTNTLVVS
tara:strand:+ start:3804 stop:6707 length:2904 start_codon:yes stop_codon:yes gene_type:complete